MIISLNWIKEFVDLSGIELDEIVKRFGLSTAEVESVTQVGDDIEKVVVAKILKVENHPNSNHLHILLVDDGSGEPVQVVCGAPNVRVGLKTFFAQVGGRVKQLKIKPAKLAGVESNGMCCGGNELGIEADTSGIVELDDNLPVGKSIFDILPVKDVLIEVDNKSLTNRPDLWGHYGIAREFAAIFNRPLKPLNLDDLAAYNKLKKLNIKVETKNCFRYSSITVDNVNKKVSSAIMKLRLNYCGMRDINLLADLTNYIMLELGQPMHAFDHAVVNGITVIEADKPIVMETLEHENHTIEPGAIVICDDKKQPVAIAGVKGGLKSGISANTNSLLIESACFDSMAIRKTSRKIGLITDASTRYEKSLDPELTVTAIARLLYLLKQVDAGVKVSSSLTDVYNFKYPIHKIKTDAEFICKRGGVKLSETEISNILTRLGFKVEKDGKNLLVTVPSWRGTKDVSIREDLVEEVFRMYGYDNIKSSTMNMPLKPVSKLENEIDYSIKHALASIFNLNEVHSYVWNYLDFNKQVGIEQVSVVHLLDASKSGQSGLRVSLVPTLLKIADENKNKFEDVSIFEIGRVFDALDKNNLVIERKKLGIVLASETADDESLYFKLKQIAEYVAENLVGTKLQFVGPADDKIYHPVNSCCIVTDKPIGKMGILHPAIAKKIDARKHFAALELDVNELACSNKVAFKYIPTSKYQPVSLDFNFVADNTVPYSTIENIINNFKCNYILEHKLKDVYVNEQVLKGKISYTINVTITPKDKTLSSADIEKFSKRFIDSFATQNIMLRT